MSRLQPEFVRIQTSRPELGGSGSSDHVYHLPVPQPGVYKLYEILLLSLRYYVNVHEISISVFVLNSKQFNTSSYIVVFISKVLTKHTL
jgi:hypothetical protein